jgi:hypothetical protein
MHSYYSSIKTLLLCVCGNILVLSWEESHLREPANLNNSWRVTIYKSRITNVSHYADLSLDSNFTAGNRLFGPWITTRWHWNSLVAGSRPGNLPIFGMHSSKYISGIRGNLGNTTRAKAP